MAGERRQESEAMVGSGSRTPNVRDGVSPAAGRRALGGRMRELRQASGMTLGDVARQIERSTATMSRLERGTSASREIDIKALLDLYAGRKPELVPDDVRSEVLSLLRASREDNWIDQYRDVLGSGSSTAVRYLELEADTQEYLSYESELIPGLLQTRDFARAMADVYRSTESDAQKERFVALRMERQRRMAGRRLHFVISEVALLRRSPFTDAAMPEQLKLLATEIFDGRENVRIQIAPSSLLLPAATGGPFVLMRLGDGASAVVYREHRDAFLDGGSDVDRFKKEFDELTANALDTEASLELVREVMRETRD